MSGFRAAAFASCVFADDERRAGAAGEGQVVFIVTNKRTLYMSNDDGVSWKPISKDASAYVRRDCADCSAARVRCFSRRSCSAARAQPSAAQAWPECERCERLLHRQCGDSVLRRWHERRVRRHCSSVRCVGEALKRFRRNRFVVACRIGDSSPVMWMSSDAGRTWTVRANSEGIVWMQTHPKLGNVAIGLVFSSVSLSPRRSHIHAH